MNKQNKQVILETEKLNQELLFIATYLHMQCIIVA